MIQNVLFPVHEEPALRNGIETGYKYIVRSDTDKIISCKTNIYQLVKNQHVLDAVMPIVEENNGRIIEQYAFSDTRTKITFQFDGKEDEIFGQAMKPRLTIFNSYDGTSRVNIRFGLMILVCTNGLMISKASKSISYKHVIKHEGLEGLEDLLKESLYGISGVIKEELEVFNSKSLKNKADIGVLYEVFPNKYHDVITHKLLEEKPVTYWDLINVGTYVLSNEADRTIESTHNIEKALFVKTRQLAARA